MIGIAFRLNRWLVGGLLVLWGLIAPAGLWATGDPSATLPQIPLTDLGSNTYKGFEGGLYPAGQNSPPVQHTNEGLARANAVQPLDVNGEVDPAGRIIFLSVGMSNTSREFCAGGTTVSHCNVGTFGYKAYHDPLVNHQTLTMINGARSQQVISQWLGELGEPNYERVANIMARMGATNRQVQVIWVKVARADSPLSPPLPAGDSDAYLLLAQLGELMRTLKLEYPNLQQVFLSSRIYGGYAPPTTNSPEPYAYESGFAVKWLIEAQIEQMETGEINPITGDLDYNSVAPWLAWGAYLWADGSVPRSDGLVWLESDLLSDGTHPSGSGIDKVGTLLIDFFKNSPFTTSWFLNEMAVSTTPTLPTPSPLPLTPTITPPLPTISPTVWSPQPSPTARFVSDALPAVRSDRGNWVVWFFFGGIITFGLARFWRR